MFHGKNSTTKRDWNRILSHMESLHSEWCNSNAKFVSTASDYWFVPGGPIGYNSGASNGINILREFDVR